VIAVTLKLKSKIIMNEYEIPINSLGKHIQNTEVDGTTFL
jgi:hypothetical protein